ncbi:TPA: hypothetical protein ACX6NV_003991 [Photobacterium damselae]
MNKWKFMVLFFSECVFASDYINNNDNVIVSELHSSIYSSADIESMIISNKDIKINGVDVNGYLKEDVEGVLGNGINSLSIDGIEQYFYNQSKGADIVIDTVTRIDDNIVFNGMLLNYKNIKRFDVNGEPIIILKGKFTVSVNQSDIDKNEGVIDFNIHYKNNQMVDNKKYRMVDDRVQSVIFSIKNDGLDIITEQFVNMLNSGNEEIKNEIIRVLNETKGENDKFIFNDLTLSVDKIDITPIGDRRLNVDVNISYVNLDSTIYGDHSNVELGPVTLTFTLDLNKDTKRFVNIHHIDIGNVSWGDGDIFAQIANVILGITTDALNPLIKEFISNFITNLLLLNSHVIEQHASSTYSSLIMNENIIFVLKGIDYLSTDDDSLSVGVGVNIKNSNKEKVAIYQYNNEPLQTENLIPLGSDISLNVESNLMNKLLASIYQTGVMSVESPLSLDSLGEKEMRETQLKFDITSSPYINLEKVDGINHLFLNVDNASLQIFNGEGAIIDTNLMLKLALDIDIKDSKISIKIPHKPGFLIKNLMVNDKDLSFLANPVGKLISTVLFNSLNSIFSDLNNTLLPSMSCISINTLSLEDNNKEHLNVIVDVNKSDNSCSVDLISPPQITYFREHGFSGNCDESLEKVGVRCYEPCTEGFTSIGLICEKDYPSYGRGVGKTPTQCGENQELDGGLCYPRCKEDYNGIGPVCWSEKAASYGRGAGSIPSNIFTGACPVGKENDAGLCYTTCDVGYNGVGPVCWLREESYGRGAGIIPRQCGANEELDAGLCYKTCSEGFTGVGPVCWNYPLIYGRGVGTIPTICPNGTRRDSRTGQCYKSDCKDGYVWAGPLCIPEQ